MSGETKISGFRQFLVLLYKGLLLRKRHYIVTLFEFVIPVFIAIIVPVIIAYNSRPRDFDENSFKGRDPVLENATFYEPFNPFKTSFYGDIEFVYAPSNDLTDGIIANSLNKWKKINGVVHSISNYSFVNEKELEMYALKKRLEQPSIVMIGTVFNNINSKLTKLPLSLDYKIRYGGSYGSNPFNNKQKYRFNGPQFFNAYSDIFLSWQATVESVFIDEKMKESGNSFDYQLQMQRFPYPPFQKTKISYLTVLVPWLVGLGFLVFIINLVRRVIEEKANGSKELLKMMGMTDCLYWTSNFVNYFEIALLATLIISIVYSVPLNGHFVFVKYSNFLLLFIILLMFMTQLILFCFAVTTFFNKTVFAVIVLIIVHCVSLSMLSVTYFVDSSDMSYLALPLISKLSICLLPTGSLLTMFFIVGAYESSGEGVHWNNLTDHFASPDLSLLMVLGYVVFSFFLYTLIIWYVDAVWPWQYGVPKPFYFPFTKSYWCGYVVEKNEDILLNSSSSDVNMDFFEEEPVGISPGVIIRNLSKVFRTGLKTKVAVNNVSLNIYNGQITAMLGHNGAGKTTTINILTGLYSASAGTVSINGYDIHAQTTAARRNLGVCPQHNVLYDTLTVEEHLKIYAALKGVAWSKLPTEVSNVLTLFKLHAKNNELAKNLSGGMKRKLCLGIAIIGGSKVLVLDEPTSGLDVEARRDVWDALLGMRHSCTIILTTHYMEEADILGDRIAILAEGEIQCCGSPMFLKRKFGTGYHLHIVKNEMFNHQLMSELLKMHVSNATLESEMERDVTYNLSNSSTTFGKMFEDLECNKTKLGVLSYGLTVTTMEDVFLRVANASNVKDKDNLNGGFQLEIQDVYKEAKQFKRSPSALNQLLGLLLKRMHYAKRHWSIFISQIILPFLIMCACLYIIVTSTESFSATYTPFKLDISDIYGKTEGFYQAIIDDPVITDLVEKEKKVFSENDVSPKATKDATNYILNYAKDNMAGYFKTLLVGTTFNKFENGTFQVTAWYNGEPYHALPLSLLLFDTALLRHVAGTGNIKLENAPLPYAYHIYYSDGSRVKERIICNIFAPLAFAFLTASFVLVPIQERSSKAKLMQLMTGIPAAMYWFCMFIWDFFIHVISCIVLIIPFAIFSHYAFFASHSEAIGTVLLMMFMYGWASIPMSYLFSFIIKKPNTGFCVIVVILVLTGIIVTPILSAMMGAEVLIPKLVPFVWFMRIFPSFCLSSGMGNVFGISYGNAFCESISPQDLELNCKSKFISERDPVFKCCKDICGNSCLNQTYPITTDAKGCGRDLAFLFGDGVVYLLLVLFFETSVFHSFVRLAKQHISRLRKSTVSVISDRFGEDSDVLAEEERIRNIHSSAANDEAIIALDLSKRYKNFYAVDHLTFGIHKEECFGLLGVNGAGKTTTFRMLTGDCYPTEGNAMIGNYSLITNLKQFQSQIGYCPQFDALIDRLTGREMISLFARLRGLSGTSLTYSVEQLIKFTDLTQHADKQTQFYSGGNKRKLSIALALIGSPPMILLDEPTAGVDPVSRRKIWNILSQARNQTGASVILTTHSMEESEALCSRLAIMVNGRFRCLGSIQQLKSKFGQGYSLIIKLKKEIQNEPSIIDSVKNYVDSNVPSAQLKDYHQGMLQYHIVDPSITLSYLFKFMDDMKPRYDLEDYLISDTSLEQIFLAFARAQR